MTQQTHRAASAAPSEERSHWANGLTTFAGCMMLLVGGFQVLVSLTALATDDLLVSTADYTYALDTTTWGWVHLVIGVLVLAAGFSVLDGRSWGRMVGVGMALVSAVGNFAFLPYYPFWSMVVIALDVLVVWALVTHDREVTR